MLVDKCVHFVYVAIDDDVQALVDRGVLGDLLRCEGFGHCGRGRSDVRLDARDRWEAGGCEGMQEEEIWGLVGYWSSSWLVDSPHREVGDVDVPRSTIRTC